MENNEWYTPPHVIEAARKTMGVINYDPASCATANKIVKAERFSDINNSGLHTYWSGNVWLNPPYSRDLIRSFTNKALFELDLSHITSMIMLVNSSTASVWYQKLLLMSDALCFPSPRLRFFDENLEQQNSPRYDNTLFYFGNNVKEFKKYFSVIGSVK